MTKGTVTVNRDSDECAYGMFRSCSEGLLAPYRGLQGDWCFPSQATGDYITAVFFSHAELRLRPADSHSFTLVLQRHLIAFLFDARMAKDGP